MLRHNVRWRWEKDMAHQAKPRTGKVIRIRRLKPAVDAAGVRAGWACHGPPVSTTPFLGGWGVGLGWGAKALE